MFRVAPYGFGNSALEGWAPFRVPLRRLRQNSSPFRIFGVLGILCGTTLAAALAFRVGIFPLWIVAIAVIAFGGFLAVAMATKILCGYERLVFLHQQVVVLGAAAVVSALCFQPVWRVLDICSLGLGMVLAFGRLGCLAVGCCHGRPCRWGVSYGRQQVRTGFPPWMEGVRLFPVQAIESFWALCIVVLGSAWIMGGAPPGVVFGFYITGYAFGRFFLEFLRGDEDRGYLFGFSEAQWSSAVLVAGVLAAERVHLLPAQLLTPAVIVFLLSALIAVSLLRTIRKSRSHALFSAKHINEVARALIFLQAPGIASPDTVGAPGATPIHVVRTSEGLKISLGRIPRFNRSLVHFSLSSEGSPLTAKDAKSLARITGYLCGSAVPSYVVAGASGVFHAVGGEAPIEVKGHVRAAPA